MLVTKMPVCWFGVGIGCVWVVDGKSSNGKLAVL